MSKITVIIVDDDKESVCALRSYLELMPEIDIKGVASHYRKAINLIQEYNPDLVFLDVEMPGKTGFELLEEFEKDGLKRKFDVIFYTAFDKYTLKALRESAFDFLLKPPREDEIKSVILRYLEKRSKPMTVIARPVMDQPRRMVAIPTSTGLQFVPKEEIVYFDCLKSGIGTRSSWRLTLNNLQTIKLRLNTKAGAILKLLSDDNFIQINQALIVNISYINMVEYKTHECYLFPPFQNKPHKISRMFMAELRKRFDMI